MHYKFKIKRVFVVDKPTYVFIKHVVSLIVIFVVKIASLPVFGFRKHHLRVSEHRNGKSVRNGKIFRLCALPAVRIESADAPFPAHGTDSAKAPEDEGSESDTPETEEEDLSERVFSETVDVSGETWQDVDLKRAKGFKGKLAVVSGSLKLINVRIEGVPAEEADLLKYFDLSPKASISCAGSGPLSLNFSALSINKGSSKTLNLKWNGQEVSGRKATWKVSDSKYVSVYRGKITAKKKGVAYVTAKYKNQQAICRLDITAIVYPKSVKVTKSVTLSLNHGRKLSAKVLPDNTTDKSVTWSSSKPGVVSVDEDGNIAALAVGKATISATACNGVVAKCTVTVNNVAPKSVDFQKLYITMHPGEDFNTAVAVNPADVSDPAVQYESSDPSVATVSQEGVVTALSYGAATITVTAKAKGSVKNTCKVCVIDPDGPRLAGLVIGINPGHQIKTIKKLYPLAPGSHKKAKGVKTGAAGRYTRQNEYEVVLQIGLKLRDLLEADGATVVMTRTKNDVMLTNIDRAKMLNAAGVDVALQLHNNSSSVHKSTGASGYIRTTGDWVAESRALSKAMCKYISKESGFKNLGVKICNDYMSLNWTTTPSVLLEMGYLSNKSDDKLLAKDSTRQKLALGIYEGLCEYFGR